MDNKPLLLLSNISQIFDSRIIFKNVNTAFYPETLNLISGNNGSGKSTLLKLIAGLLKPFKGEVKRLFSEAPSYLGHDNFVYSQLTPLENLAFWCQVSGVKAQREKIEEVLIKLGLKNFSSEKTLIFSRGMLQKLNLARILLNNSPLILLDEPFTGLDVTAQEFLTDLLKSLKKKGSCILLVTHALPENFEKPDTHYHISGYDLKKID